LSVVALDSDGQQKIMIQSDRQRSPLLCPQAFFSTEPNQALCPALYIVNAWSCVGQHCSASNQLAYLPYSMHHAFTHGFT